MKIEKWSGKPITKPGIYRGVPIEKYHSQEICDGPSISSSGLRTLWSKSPKHFYAAWDGNPDRDDDTDTEALLLGRAAHHLLLGEADFSTLFVKPPDALRDEDGDLLPWQGNRKVCKQWIKDQQKAGRVIITEKQLDIIRGMARSLAAEPLVRDAGILQGDIECSMFARHPETGVWIKTRPDAVPVGGQFCDLKTTASVLSLDLKQTLRKYQYHMQSGLIWLACELLKIDFTAFALVFVEKKSPFCARIVEMPDQDVSRGRLQCEAMLRLFKKCLDAGEWPGPGNADAELFGLSITEAEWIDKRLAAGG